MNAGTLLKIGRDVITLLETHGILLPDGSFSNDKLNSLGEDLQFASAIEGIMKAHGVAFPEQVDKIMAALPLVAAFLGQ